MQVNMTVYSPRRLSISQCKKLILIKTGWEGVVGKLPYSLLVRCKQRSSSGVLITDGFSQFLFYFYFFYGSHRCGAGGLHKEGASTKDFPLNYSASFLYERQNVIHKHSSKYKHNAVQSVQSWRVSLTIFCCFSINSGQYYIFSRRPVSFKKPRYSQYYWSSGAGIFQFCLN